MIFKILNKLLFIILSVTLFSCSTEYSNLLRKLKGSSKENITSWYNHDWMKRKKITIKSSEVNGTLTNFPVLIYRETDIDLNASAQSGAIDIVFTKNDHITKIPHEIEYYSDVNGSIYAWVNIPEVSESNDTIIYMYYGNPDAPDQQDGNSVWDSNYLGVWHLNNDPGVSDILDSTANGFNGTPLGGMNSGNLVNGRVGPALDFDGINNHIDLGDINETDSLSKLTVSFWTQIDGYNNYMAFVSKTGGLHTEGWSVQTGGTGYSYVDEFLFNPYYNDSEDYGYTNISAISTGTWYHVYMVYDGTLSADIDEIKGFINGEKMTIGISGDIYDSITESSYSLMFGEVDGQGVKLDGRLDEIRISNIPRSAEWIATSYNNQDSPASFIDVAAEEDRP